MNVWIVPHIVKTASQRKLVQHPRKRANATPDILERPRVKVAQLAKSRSKRNISVIMMCSQFDDFPYQYVRWEKCTGFRWEQQESGQNYRM